MDKKTKIVATFGPAFDKEPRIISEMIKEGVDVFRLNMSHKSIDEAIENIKTIRAVSKTVGILFDSKGPEIRTGKFEGETFLKPGSIMEVREGNKTSSENIIYLTHKNVTKILQKNDLFFLSDGLIELQISGKTKGKCFAKVIQGGTVKDRKNVSIPGRNVRISTLTKKDKEDFRLAIQQDADFFAISFVQTQKDVTDLRRILNKHKSNMQLISKIECQSAIDNIDELIKVSDGIMVARGDLGTEVTLEKVPMYQKEIIQKCNIAAKPVITATQMLDSMMSSPVPTRAEVSDVSNAILDGTDAVMLSGETAAGNFPLRSVKTMAKISRSVEEHKNKIELLDHPMIGTKKSVPEIIARSVEEAVDQLNLDFVLVRSSMGINARILSRRRLDVPIYAITFSETTFRQLKLSYGVHPIKIAKSNNPTKNVSNGLKILKKEKLVNNKMEFAYATSAKVLGSKDHLVLNFFEVGKVSEAV